MPHQEQLGQMMRRIPRLVRSLHHFPHDSHSMVKHQLQDRYGNMVFHPQLLLNIQQSFCSGYRKIHPMPARSHLVNKRRYIFRSPHICYGRWKLFYLQLIWHRELRSLHPPCILRSHFRQHEVFLHCAVPFFRHVNHIPYRYS